MKDALFLVDMVTSMKRETITKFSFTQEEIDAAIAAAPDFVDPLADPDCPYDPNDAASVRAYWSNAILTFPGGHPHQDPLWRTNRQRKKPETK
jgi:hypothetical protein